MLPNRKHKRVSLNQDIKASGAGNILAKLYRKMLLGLGIGPDRYEALFDRYVQKATLDPRRKSEIRAGLKEALLAEEMTIKTFVKGMEFLNIPKYTISVTIHGRTGKTRVFELDINQGDLTADEDDKDI